MDKRIRIGIIGAGVFGNYHANKCTDNPHVDFVGVYDVDNIRAAQVAAKHGVTIFETFGDMLTDVEAVIISCCAKHHGQMALQALQKGCHCLIEKPLAATLDDAQKILDLSHEDLIVQAGHQERFVVRAIGLPDIPETPKAIRAFRLGKYSQRGTDVSVTLDLMSHDLDLVLWLMGEFPHEVIGKTEKVRSQSADIANARLEFKAGYAELTASRAAGEFRRTMEIEYPSGTVHVDFNAKSLTHNTPFDLDIDFATNPTASDSLGAATDSFVESILRGVPIAISAQDGYDAVKLALMIDSDGEA